MMDDDINHPGDAQSATPGIIDTTIPEQEEGFEIALSDHFILEIQKKRRLACFLSCEGVEQTLHCSSY